MQPICLSLDLEKVAMLSSSYSVDMPHDAVNLRNGRIHKGSGFLSSHSVFNSFERAGRKGCEDSFCIQRLELPGSGSK